MNATSNTPLETSPKTPLKISLVIPAYNEEKLIAGCVESVLANSAGLLHEIIVVDNNSIDDTKVVAESIAKNNSRVRVCSEDKKGTSAARQKGVDLASAETDLIAFIDADTRMQKGWCETVLAEFQRDPNLVALSGPYSYYDLPAWQRGTIWLFWRTLAWFFYAFTKYMAMGGNLVIKKDTLEKMGGLDTSITFYGDDTDMVRRASKFGKVKFKFSFTIDSSGRRFLDQGLFRTGYLYGINFFSQVLAKRSVTKKYTDVR